MSFVSKLRRIFDRESKIKFVILLVGIIVGALLEMLALSVVSPFISIMIDNSIIASNVYIKWVYDFLKFSKTGSFLALLSFLLAGIYIFRGIYLYSLSKAQNRFIARRRVRLSDALLKKILSYSYIYHSNRNVSELQNVILTDVQNLFALISCLVMLISEAFMCFFILVFLLIASLPMTLCVIGLAGTCVFMYFKMFRSRIKRAGIRSREKNAEMIKAVNQAIGGIKEVKVSHREEYFHRVFKTSSDEYSKAATYYQVVNTLPKLFIETICFGGSFAIVGLFILGGTDLSDFVPQLSLFVLAAFRLLPAVSRMVNHFVTVIYHRFSIDAVYKSLFEEKDDASPAAACTEEFSRNYCDIVVRDISFRYPGIPYPILERASLIIPDKASVAFIGASGAGKTTLADLILGILAPQSGAVYYEGESIHHNFEKWCKRVGYIPQQIYLLDGSILENVAFGIYKEEIDEQKAWRALEQAQLKDFVQSLPEGIYTMVGDRGVRLSGGQRQRIGIARAIYNDPPILVLDEATSSLDTETESAVMDAIKGFKGDKTVIIVAHRLSTIEYCDIVYRVEGKTVTRER